MMSPATWDAMSPYARRTNRWIRRRIESSGVASRLSAADQLKRSAWKMHWR
jgi:hypothetical protein